MNLKRSLVPLLVAVLVTMAATGCAAQRYAEETYVESGVAFAHANSDDIARWIATDATLTTGEQTQYMNALTVWRGSPGVPEFDVAFDDAVGMRLESWAVADPSLSDLTRRAVLADIRSWRKLVAGRRGTP